MILKCIIIILIINNKLIDIDEIPIKSNKSLIEFGKGKLKDNINNNIPLTKNSNSFINIDDIVIKPIYK